MRASTADGAIRLVPPRILNLEEAIEFIRDDVQVEVTSRPSGCAESTEVESAVGRQATGGAGADLLTLTPTSPQHQSSISVLPHHARIDIDADMVHDYTQADGFRVPRKHV